MVAAAATVSGQPRLGYHRRSSGASFALPFWPIVTHMRGNKQEEPSGHVVVKTIGPLEGKFTFTSVEAGDHSICLSTNYTSWFSHTHIRLHLDIVVGSTKADVETDRTHVSELANKVRDLNQKLEDIRREQQYQREREEDFRDLSEATNARAVWYSLAQIIVLVATCAWQLRHLKVCISNFRNCYEILCL